MDSTPKKLHQKGWFMWVMLIFFFPIGLFLLWRYSGYSKRSKIIITGLWVTAFVISTNIERKTTTHTTSTPQITQSQEAEPEATPHEIQSKEPPKDDPTQNEKDAFLLWNTSFQSDLKKVDREWKLWGETFTALGNGSIDRYKAYDNLKFLSSAMSRHNSKFNDYIIPLELSKEHKEKMTAALKELSLWTYCRYDACDDMMDLLDDNNLKPSELDKVKEKIKLGDVAMLNGLASIMEIQNELGLVEQDKK